MMPSSSNFRTRFDTVLRLASTAFAISRNDFRASAFKSRRILTSRSSRRAGAIVSSPTDFLSFELLRHPCGTIRTMSHLLSIFRSSVPFGRLRVYICSKFCPRRQTGSPSPSRREGYGNRSEHPGESEEDDRGFRAETDRDRKDSLDRPAVRRRARSASAHHDPSDFAGQRRIQARGGETG